MQNEKAMLEKASEKEVSENQTNAEKVDKNSDVGTRIPVTNVVVLKTGKPRMWANLLCIFMVALRTIRSAAYEIWCEELSACQGLQRDT